MLFWLTWLVILSSWQLFGPLFKKLGNFLQFSGHPGRGAKIPTFDFYLFVCLMIYLFIYLFTYLSIYFRFNFTENRETSRISEAAQSQSFPDFAST